jgi:hypothetical protein
LSKFPVELHFYREKNSLGRSNFRGEEFGLLDFIQCVTQGSTSYAYSQNPL